MNRQSPNTRCRADRHRQRPRPRRGQHLLPPPGGAPAARRLRGRGPARRRRPEARRGGRAPGALARGTCRTSPPGSAWARRANLFPPRWRSRSWPCSCSAGRSGRQLRPRANSGSEPEDGTIVFETRQPEAGLIAGEMAVRLCDALRRGRLDRERWFRAVETYHAQDRPASRPIIRHAGDRTASRSRAGSLVDGAQGSSSSGSAAAATASFYAAPMLTETSAVARRREAQTRRQRASSPRHTSPFAANAPPGHRNRRSRRLSGSASPWSSSRPRAR